MPGALETVMVTMGLDNGVAYIFLVEWESSGCLGVFLLAYRAFTDRSTLRKCLVPKAGGSSVQSIVVTPFFDNCEQREEQSHQTFSAKICIMEFNSFT